MAYPYSTAYPRTQVAFGKDRWWDIMDYPTTIYDQHFGTGVFGYDLLPPSSMPGYVLRPRNKTAVQSSGQSEVKNEKDKFQVMLNVCHFKPNDVKVKVVDNYIVIHGKHEEKCDDHGFIQREFTRRYVLPEGTEAKTVKSSWSVNGILTVEAPKKVSEEPPEHVIPIKTEKQPGVDTELDSIGSSPVDVEDNKQSSIDLHQSSSSVDVEDNKQSSIDSHQSSSSVDVEDSKQSSSSVDVEDNKQSPSSVDVEDNKLEDSKQSCLAM